MGFPEFLTSLEYFLELPEEKAKSHEQFLVY
jgi:hypothetical protein